MRTLQPSWGCTTVRGVPGAIGEFTTRPNGTSSPKGTPLRRTSSIAPNASLNRSALARPLT